MFINPDSFSDGQIGSKLWLCEELENLGWSSHITHIYAGWYALTAFLLLNRKKFQVNYIRSFDIDPECQIVADIINSNWICQDWKFKAYTHDCNMILKNIMTPDTGKCDLIINTSTEHFKSMDWFHNIPAGTRVILQGNNMLHDDHYVYSETLNDFIKTYPLAEINYTGQKEFKYSNWGFTRYMIVGIK